MDANLLLIPMALHAIATMLLYFPMGQVRVKSVVEGKVRASVYRYNREEPEESLKFSNAIRNQNETGVLFYAACLTAFVSDAASGLTIALAFAFLVLKLAHVAIHVTSNNLRLRRPMFSAALLVLLVFWIVNLLVLAGVI